jgi:hypothetical protein
MALLLAGIRPVVETSIARGETNLSAGLGRRILFGSSAALSPAYEARRPRARGKDVGRFAHDHRHSG